MRHIKLTLAYDGTDFEGWQRQSRGRTVQGVLEEKLSIFHKEPITILASGRTDSGVHAHGQVVSFFSTLDSIPLHVFPRALNSILPPDISVSRAESVSPDFHPRYDAVRRTYKFYIDTRIRPNPASQRYSWKISWIPNISRLNRFAEVVLGTHDFSTFCSVNEQITNHVRTIHTSVFFPEGPYLVYRITGQSFLWKMVRSLVGSMVHYEHTGLDPRVMSRYIVQKDRKLAGPTAPAQGLFLHRVAYKDDPVLF